jgi:ketosteroid isomerase-like protein
MTTISTPATFDADALRRAFEQRDVSSLAALYSDDATLEFVDAEHPPSRPQRVQGREAVDAHIAELFARDMTHRVQDVVLGEDALGYSIHCAYPDGTRVVCVATATLRDGRIARQLAAQAWDAA